MLSTRFQPFRDKGQPLVLQFSLKHEQNMDFEGNSANLFPASLDQK